MSHDRLIRKALPDFFRINSLFWRCWLFETQYHDAAWKVESILRISDALFWNRISCRPDSSKNVLTSIRPVSGYLNLEFVEAFAFQFLLGRCQYRCPTNFLLCVSSNRQPNVLLGTLLSTTACFMLFTPSYTSWVAFVIRFTLHALYARITVYLFSERKIARHFSWYGFILLEKINNDLIDFILEVEHAAAKSEICASRETVITSMVAELPHLTVPIIADVKSSRPVAWILLKLSQNRLANGHSLMHQLRRD